MHFCERQAPVLRVCHAVSFGEFQCHFFHSFNVILNYLCTYMGDFGHEKKSGVDTQVEIPVGIVLEKEKAVQLGCTFND